jgi:arylsulfatase A-like enzyme
VLPRQAALLLASALLCGIFDALAVIFEVFDAREGIEYVPNSIWLWSLAIWAGVAVGAVLLVVILPRVMRGLAVSLLLTGMPLYLLGIRIIRPFASLRHLPRVPLALAFVLAWLLIGYLLRFPQTHDRVGARVRLAIAAGSILMTAVFLAVVTVTTTLDAAPTAFTDHRSTRAPNVVLIIVDTLRADTAGLMPNLQRFMARGTSFKNAYSTAPWTLPSHFSMVTGKAARRVTWSNQHFDVPRPLPIVLDRLGYATSGIVANPLLNQGTGFTRGFQQYDLYARGLDLCRTAPLYFAKRFSPMLQHTVCTAGASTIIPAARRQMAAAKGPFFLLINFTDVHDSYFVPARCRPHSAVTPLDLAALSRAAREDGVMEDERRLRVRRVYEDAARCLDASLQSLFQTIDALPEPTVTIVTADHGEQFGTHRLFAHGNSLYPQLTHVPLAVVGRGFPAKTITAPVSLKELYDLVLEVASPGHASRLADLAMGRPAEPLSPAAFLFGDSPSSSRIRARVAIADGHLYLIHRADRRVELYDLDADPQALQDLAAKPEFAEQRARLDMMARELATTADEAEQTRKMRSLGYIQ